MHARIMQGALATRRCGIDRAGRAPMQHDTHRLAFVIEPSHDSRET